MKNDMNFKSHGRILKLQVENMHKFLISKIKLEVLQETNDDTILKGIEGLRFKMQFFMCSNIRCAKFRP